MQGWSKLVSVCELAIEHLERGIKRKIQRDDGGALGVLFGEIRKKVYI
jgi:hypothetical protein